ncbi:hypothetical protein BFW01_g1711 [Lasiodiplodia theobromae]|nr:hypothetical protein BFW01_g1711 [Lasiodiplodia theobromae]
MLKIKFRVVLKPNPPLKRFCPHLDLKQEYTAPAQSGDSKLHLQITKQHARHIKKGALVLAKRMDQRLAAIAEQEIRPSPPPCAMVSKPTSAYEGSLRSGRERMDAQLVPAIFVML